jgi:hypothetical protein
MKRPFDAAIRWTRKHDEVLQHRRRWERLRPESRQPSPSAPPPFQDGRRRVNRSSVATVHKVAVLDSAKGHASHSAIGGRLPSLVERQCIMNASAVSRRRGDGRGLQGTTLARLAAESPGTGGRGEPQRGGRCTFEWERASRSCGGAAGGAREFRAVAQSIRGLWAGTPDTKGECRREASGSPDLLSSAACGPGAPRPTGPSMLIRGRTRSSHFGIHQFQRRAAPWSWMRKIRRSWHR